MVRRRKTSNIWSRAHHGRRPPSTDIRPQHQSSPKEPPAKYQVLTRLLPHAKGITNDSFTLRALHNPAGTLPAKNYYYYSMSVTLLELSVSCRIYTDHVSQGVSKAKSALTKLYRFRDLATGLKLYLIKALVLPILT